MSDSTSGEEQAAAISVLLPTRDRPEDLVRCVRSVLACTHRNFELVIIDQSTTPFTCDDPRVTVLHSTAPGKSAALNEGAAVAAAPILAFVDDDCTVPETWLDHIESTFDDHATISMMFGNAQAAPHDPMKDFIPTVDMGRFQVISRSRDAWKRGGGGANLSVRRTLFDTLQGFDPMIGPGVAIPACEEYDFYYRALVSGANVARDPASVVVHWGRRSLADGAAARLLAGYHFSEGAVIGKHLRLRDPAMLLVGTRVMFENGREVAWTLLRTRRLSGSGITRLLYLGRGIVRGFTTGVDRRRRMFRPSTHRRARAPEPLMRRSR